MSSSLEVQTFVTRPRYAEAVAIPIPPTFINRGGDETFDFSDEEFRKRLKEVTKWCKGTPVPKARMLPGDPTVMTLPVGPEGKRAPAAPGQVIVLDQRTEAFFVMDMDQFVQTFERFDRPEEDIDPDPVLPDPPCVDCAEPDATYDPDAIDISEDELLG